MLIRAALLFEAQRHAIYGLLEVAHLDLVRVAPRGIQRRFIDDIGQVGAHHARRLGRDSFQIHVRADLELARVHVQDGLALLEIRPVQDHLPIEPPGAQQRRVQHLGRVGGRHDQHRLRRVEAIHFHQQLVQCLIALIVAHHDRLRPSAIFRWRPARR